MAKVADKHDKAMANTKWSAWWHNSNKGLFLFIFNFQWTKNKKQQKERKKKSNHVGFIYLQKKRRKKKKQNFSHPWLRSQIIGFRKGRGKSVIISLWIHFFKGFTRTYIHLCSQCVVCAVTVWPCNLIPPAAPSPPITQIYTDLWNRMYKSLCLALNSAGP